MTKALFRKSRRLASICLLHHFASTSCRILLPLIALTQGASQAFASSLVSMQALAPAVAGLVIPALVARIGLMRCAAIGTGCSAIALVGLSASSAASMLFVIAGAVGVGYAMSAVAIQRELGYCVEQGDALAFDRLSLFTAVSTSVSPLLAGVLAGSVGLRWSLVVFGSLAIFGLCVSLLGSFDDTRSRDSVESSAFGRLFQVTAESRIVLGADLLISLNWNVIAMLTILHGASARWAASEVTAILAAMGIGVTAARLARRWFRLRAGDVLRIRMAIASSGLGLLLFVFPVPWWATCLLMVGIGFGLGLSLASVLSELHRRSADIERTRVLALRQLGWSVCGVVGPAAIGLAADESVSPLLCLTLASITLAAACWRDARD